MRYRTQIGAVLLVVVTALAFKSTTVGITGEETESEYTIGVSIPMSGDMQEFGVAVRNGIELAKSEREEDFKKMEFVYEDNQYDPKQAISNLNKFSNYDNIDLLYIWGDHPATAVAPLIEKRKIPTVAVLTDPRPVAGLQYLVRYANSYTDYSEVMMNYIFEKGYKKLGIVYVDDPYYVNLIEGLKSELREDQSLTLISSHSYGENDFKTSIAKIKQADFDIIGVYLMPGQVSAFYNQAAALNCKKDTFGADVFESQQEIRQAKGNMKGAVYAHNILTPSFRDKYVVKYGNDQQIAYAAQAYEFAALISEMLGKGDRVVQGLEVLDILTRKKIIMGTASGPYRIVNELDNGKSYKFQVQVKTVK